MSAAPTKPELLKARSTFYKQIRQFFQDRNVLEVETPVLSQASIPDPNIHSLTTTIDSAPFGKATTFYLQTSPEFHMKRLLAEGAGCIFQISKAFRNGEAGHHHNPEFSMLEWYRVGYQLDDLMEETSELLTHLIHSPSAKYRSYQSIFQEYLNIDPLVASLEELKNTAHNLDSNRYQSLEMSHNDDWLNLLFSDFIEPHLGLSEPVMIYHYPASQSALARISIHDPRVSERFEVFYKGKELGNGFYELACPKEQRARFQHYNSERRQRQLPEVPIDEHFIQSLIQLPDCSGIAMGLDRILMLKLGLDNIQDVLSFPLQKA